MGIFNFDGTPEANAWNDNKRLRDSVHYDGDRINAYNALDPEYAVNTPWYASTAIIRVTSAAIAAGTMSAGLYLYSELSSVIDGPGAGQYIESSE